MSDIPVSRSRPSACRVNMGLAVLAALALSTPVSSQMTDADGSPIDPIAIMQERINSGDLVLEFDERHGYLPAVLDALEIPLSSQTLIFSRTSLQTNLITPWTPRAVYFNDDNYIGWVQDSKVLEVGVVDPDDGGVFYTLTQEAREKPTFVRENTTCLMCHESRSVTEGVPGFMVRSVLVDRFGYPISPLHEGTTSDRTPFDERLGGYYVTGTHEGAGHAGNTMAPVLSHEVSDLGRYLDDFDMTSDGNVTDLEGRFDIEPYLTPHSDIVALLVLTHQTRAHNLITLAHSVAAEAYLDITVSGVQRVVPPSTQVKIDGVIERLTRAMLFSREAPLAGRVEGTSGFADEFSAMGPFDSQGRSFRQFDLERRLFRYPFSFLIYTDAFDALPDLMKEYFYKRVEEVLSGMDQTEDFANLDAEDRAALREILAETKPEFLDFIAR